MADSPELEYASVVGNSMSALVSLTVLIAEYCQTLELEVDVIWAAPWNLVKYLYFADRILPFLVIPFVLVYNLMADPTPKECTIVFTIPWIGIVMCILISEAILYIRLYALSGHARWALFLILINGSAIFTACFVLLILYLTHGTWGPSRITSLPGCVGRFGNNGHLVMIGYAFLLYSVVATMVLCMYFGIRMFWSSRQSPLIKIFYRDGTFYFVVLAFMSIANAVVAVFLPGRYRFILSSPQGVLHSTLSIRMILHLRDQARCEMGFSTVRKLAQGTKSTATFEAAVLDQSHLELPSELDMGLRNPSIAVRPMA